MKLAAIAVLLCALAHCVLGADLPDVPTTVPALLDEAASVPSAPQKNTTTAEPPVTTLNGTTVAPPTPTTNGTTGAPPLPTTNGTTVAPPLTTANGTTVAPLSTTTNGTEAPTTPAAVPTAAPSGQLPERHFDALSFVGGIILSLGCLAILYVGFKFYKARTERNYHTL
uniref:Putative mucin core protein n=1 Tax=Ixodes ricinus TaxID=34613 RepID=A0A147BGH2_IXORI